MMTDFVIIADSSCDANRVSGAAAFFGNLFNVKPMIISDIHGYNVAIEKVKGRKKFANSRGRTRCGNVR